MILLVDSVAGLAASEPVRPLTKHEPSCIELGSIALTDYSSAVVVVLEHDTMTIIEDD